MADSRLESGLRRVASWPGLVLLATALAAFGCQPPPCRRAPVQLPPEAQQLDWQGAGPPVVAGASDWGDVRLLLDTGTPRTSWNLTSAAQSASGTKIDLSQARLHFGDAHAGPLSARFFASDFPADVVVGNDVLFQLPLRFDARERTIEVGARFSNAPTSSGTDLELHPAERCSGGPGQSETYLLSVLAHLEGREVRLVIDTGAQGTFVRQEGLDSLGARPSLSGIEVSSGFAGTFEATARRASLEVSGETVPDLALLSSPAVELQLDALSDLARDACDGRTGCQAVRFDGFLGWSFLRQFAVSLSMGATPTTKRRLELRRYSSQTHWSRDWIGLGVRTQLSENPAGLRVVGFLSVSPGRDAGIRAGDVVVEVDGLPAREASQLSPPLGQTVRITLLREAQPLELSATSAELLPNP